MKFLCASLLSGEENIMRKIENQLEKDNNNDVYSKVLTGQFPFDRHAL